MRRLLVILVVLGLAVPATAGARGLGVHWEALLPALGGTTTTQPRAEPGCRTPSIACIDGEIRHMRRVQQRWGCDHRAVFDTTYLELTRQLRETVAANPRFVADPGYLYYEDALFADVYFRTQRAWSGGRPIPEAWRIALQTARTGEANGAQDMLLGINAHVQNDMPFVLAALGQRTPSGASRKPDHDVVNDVLDAAYQRVVDAVTRRFDPFVATTNSNLTPLDDVAGLELVRGWREAVWRNAERLLAAPDDAARREVAGQIQANAATWARLIAMDGSGLPGYRAQRDAYCRAALAD